MKKFSRGWGFKIDYARAIADDDLMIAHAQRCIEGGWYQESRSIPLADGSGQLYQVMDIWMLVLEFRDVSSSLGLSDQDVADYAAYVDYDVWARHPILPAERPGRAGYDRGKEILAMIDAIGGIHLPTDEKQAKKWLSGARASRSRHVRNRDKFGGPGGWRDGAIRPGK
jgi:hypothetical protein